MGDFERVDLVAAVERARRAQATLRVRVLADDCPRCTIGDPSFRECKFRGMDECKLKPDLDRVARYRDRVFNLRVAEAPPELCSRVITDSLDGEYAAVVAARRMLAGHGRLVVLAGPPGSLKTSAAMLVLAERGGQFLPAALLAEYSKETTTAVNRARVIGHLVLDDVGRGRSASKPGIENAEELVCARFDAGLPTVVATNLPPEAFLAMFGGEDGRVADRLRLDPIGLVGCYEASKRVRQPDPRSAAAGDS